MYLPKISFSRRTIVATSPSNEGGHESDDTDKVDDIFGGASKSADKDSNFVRLKAVAPLDGLPNNVTLYGKGGGYGVKVETGPFAGYHLGGGKRKKVRGKGFHPTALPFKTLPWAFPPIVTSLGIHPSDKKVISSYQSLPQNFARPGGELVEITITPPMFAIGSGFGSNRSVQYTPVPPFFFVSDSYTVTQMNATINNICAEHHAFTISAPIALNSTGNIKPESVVQFYRGDSAALLLQGYNNTKELPGYRHIGPNPPFPTEVGLNLVSCIDKTVANSIPLMDGDGFPARDKGAVAASVVGFFLALVVICWYINKKPTKKPSPLLGKTPRSAAERDQGDYSSLQEP